MYNFSGVSRISFRGGSKYFCKVVFAWRSHAFARGVRGHAPPRKFLKMVQFGGFWRIFCKKNNCKNIHFLYKNNRYCITAHIIFRGI